MKKILFCLLAFYTPVSIVIAQNTTNSPTSMFGLGELSTGEGGQYAGLGGTGIALRGNNFLNNANPASLTELTEQRFQIDAVSWEHTRFIRNEEQVTVPSPEI